MNDVIVIGAGPAGISAATYAKRAGLDITVIHSGIGALKNATRIENYYGFPDVISGTELYENGLSNARRLGIHIIEDEVMGLLMNDAMTGFVVSSGKEKYEAHAVVLATGASHKSPQIKNLADLEGRGVSHCAVCDAFFYRQKVVAVIGAGEYALSEAATLSHVAQKVILLTNGETPAQSLPPEYETHAEKISSIIGSDRVNGVRLANGKEIELSGIFVAIGTAGSTELARKVGALIQNNSIKTDNEMATNVPGLFAAGDATGGLLQISKAAYEGTQAGLSVVKYIRNRFTKG